MRILLAQNSLYYPAHGGGDKSNRLLIEALAARGHECRVLARIPAFGDEAQARYLRDLAERGVAASVESTVRFSRNAVDVRVVTLGNLRARFEEAIADFRPEAILCSTDDPAQLLLEVALRSDARVAFLTRATLALPFGPDCAFPSEAKTARIRACDLRVGVSEYVADYMRRYGAMDAVHVPISLMEPGSPPQIAGRFENEFATLVNPCAVKGISIFLELAESMLEVNFAAVPTWGTNSDDLAALRARANVTVLDPVDDIDVLLARTRVLLVPSLWAEARSRIIVEAMARGVPVIASNVGGIPEAKMGIAYVLPVSPIVRYEPRLDEQMVPVAKVPPQDVLPWQSALRNLWSDTEHWAAVSQASRAAALEYIERCTVGPFERLLLGAGNAQRPKPAQAQRTELAADKKKLLSLMLRKRAGASAWFPGADSVSGERLFCFPHAAGGASVFAGWSGVCPVRLPGRESRLAEAPFERMAPLVEALANAIASYTEQPFSFFGHSMGAVVAFELARELRRRGLPLPRILIASGARAPQFRRDHVPQPDPTDEELLAQLRGLEGTPNAILSDPLALRAILPAIRADVRLYRRYVYAEDAPLACPIRACGGMEDAHVTLQHLEAWREQTTADFEVRQFPGGHFYLRNLASVSAFL